MVRAIIVPGNGCTQTLNSNWYGWAARRLRDSGLFSEVLAPNMPSPFVAEREVWLPFLLEQCKPGGTEDYVIIGHSSGAVAAMRL